jgi:hypothetical protein
MPKEKPGIIGEIDKDAVFWNSATTGLAAEATFPVSSRAKSSL